MPDIVIYGTQHCGYCVRAQQFLTARGLPYTYIYVDREPQRRDEMLRRSAGRYTVPQIFIDDFHVGGYDDMIALDRQGKLDPLLGLQSIKL